MDQLYQMMQDAWLEYEAYADEAGLEAYNATLPPNEQLTKKNLLSSARTALGYTISYHLQQQFVPQSLKDKYLGVTKEIQAALRKRIEKVDWMSETTKQNAIDKIDHYTLNVGFPDQWHTDCIPTLADCPTLVETMHRLKAGNAQGFSCKTRNEQLRKFYESYAHLWCVQYGQKKFDILKKSDVHSHARLRVNGVVMNTDL